MIRFWFGHAALVASLARRLFEMLAESTGGFHTGKPTEGDSSLSGD
jgi:hypothetical protein